MNKDFAKIVSGYSNEIQELAVAVRALIYKTLPNVLEYPYIKQKAISYGTGPKKMSEHFCYIIPAKDHVTLGFYYGAELSDPKKILSGAGKMLRSVKIKNIDELRDENLIRILESSTTYKVPPIKSK